MLYCDNTLKALPREGPAKLERFQAAKFTPAWATK